MDILEILGRIGFDTKLFVFNLINFAVIALLLQKFFFKSIANVISERQRMIDEGIQNAESAKSQLAVSEQKGEEIIQEAKQKANEVIKNSQQDAKESSEKLKQSAQVEINEMKEKARIASEKERKETVEKIKSDTADLALLATEKIIKEKLDEKKDKELITDYLNTLKV